jgi:sulfoxide reductase heme-binding subunit YedZ
MATATPAGRSVQSKRRRRLLKLGVGALALAPAAVIVFRFFTDRLGANPIALAMNQIGLWTLITLLATLACTPIKIVTGWKWPLEVRRLLGLCSFFYVCLHLGTYVVVDQGFAWDDILKDIVKRKFITVGFLGFLLLLPLAVTSTNKMVKRLGFPRWKRLHRLSYVAATAGVIHFVWRVKADLTEPLIYAGVLGLLLTIRAVAWGRARWAPSALPASSR